MTPTFPHKFARCFEQYQHTSSTHRHGQPVVPPTQREQKVARLP